MIQQCPFCSRMHDSEDHDPDWHFACCGFACLVWHDNNDGQGLVLEFVPEKHDEGEVVFSRVISTMRYP